MKNKLDYIFIKNFNKVNREGVGFLSTNIEQCKKDIWEMLENKNSLTSIKLILYRQLLNSENLSSNEIDIMYSLSKEPVIQSALSIAEKLSIK
jgi:hypothetical protein